MTIVSFPNVAAWKTVEDYSHGPRIQLLEFIMKSEPDNCRILPSLNRPATSDLSDHAEWNVKWSANHQVFQTSRGDHFSSCHGKWELNPALQCLARRILLGIVSFIQLYKDSISKYILSAWCPDVPRWKLLSPYCGHYPCSHGACLWVASVEVIGWLPGSFLPVSLYRSPFRDVPTEVQDVDHRSTAPKGWNS